MINIIFKQLLHKKDLNIAFLILFCLFISDIVFSRNHWGKKNILITYNEKEKSISIQSLIFNYQFGPFGERAYLEHLDFEFSTNGEQYKKLMRWEVVDQDFSDLTDIRMRDKLDDAKILFSGTIFPDDAVIWNGPYQYVVCKNILTLCYAKVIWYIPENLNVKDILVIGSWHVNGLYCNDNIREKYVVTPTNRLNYVLTDSNQTKIHLSENKFGEGILRR